MCVTVVEIIEFQVLEMSQCLKIIKYYLLVIFNENDNNRYTLSN